MGSLGLAEQLHSGQIALVLESGHGPFRAALLAVRRFNDGASMTKRKSPHSIAALSGARHAGSCARQMFAAWAKASQPAVPLPPNLFESG